MLSKRLHARLFMGSYLLRHTARRLIPFAPGRGLARFLESFLPEGLDPPTAAARELLPTADRCQACDLCLQAPVPAGALSARDLVLRVVRGGNDWRWARPLLAPDAAYDGAEALCPDRIPVRRVAALVRGVA